MAKEKFIEVIGLNTRYLEAGEGDPLLFIHGGQFGPLSSASDWQLNINGLSKSFHIFAIDKPGQGFTENPKMDADYTIGLTVRHAYEFLKARNVGRAHIVGHSRGGYTACRLAMEYPEVVKTLSLVDSGTLITKKAPGGTHGQGEWYEKVDKRANKMTTAGERCHYAIAANSFSDNHITEEYLSTLVKIEELPKIKKVVVTMGRLGGVFTQDVKEKVNETHNWIKSGGLKIPTLIVWGFNDPSSTFERDGLETLRFLFPNVSNVQMCVLNQAGHFCFREQPNAFNSALKAFVISS